MTYTLYISHKTMKKLLPIIVFSLLILTWCDNTPPPEPIKQINNPAPIQEPTESPIDNQDIPFDDITLIDQSDNRILSSIDDKIRADSMWCWTFQLLWNETIDKLIHTDIVFRPQQLVQAENLNKKTFTKEQLSEDSYFLTYWLFVKPLKKIIEDWIKEKFDETSSIINLLDWDSAPDDESWYSDGGRKEYVFYTMLKKVFKFAKSFDNLDPAKFDEKYDNIKYFGIDDDSNYELRSQVKVLYYNSEDDFAVILKTNEWEEVILSRWTIEDSFINTYKEILAKSEKYDWKKYFSDDDYLKVPNLSLNVLREYNEFYDKNFYDSLWNRWEILKALQTIEFDLDANWWRIKSEAMMYLALDSAIWPVFEEPEYRYFYFNKPFTIFLKEENKQIPYFAARVVDITKFQ